MTQTKLEFKVAGKADQGARDYQEDSHRFWRSSGLERLDQPILAVLADGMGGHVSGEVASRLACERFVEVFVSSDAELSERLSTALVASNEAIALASSGDQQLTGMGCTLVASYLSDAGLHWVSVGDSSLLLVRSGSSYRLNADHSFGALLDRQAAANIISIEEARADPRRRSLRSALIGSAISAVDLRADPTVLQHDDWVILASDGLETLTGEEIAHIVSRNTDRSPGDIVSDLLNEVIGRNVTHQDNVTILAIHAIDPEQVVTRRVERGSSQARAPDIDDTRQIAHNDIPRVEARGSSSDCIASDATDARAAKKGQSFIRYLTLLMIIVMLLALVGFYMLVTLRDMHVTGSCVQEGIEKCGLRGRSNVC